MYKTTKGALALAGSALMVLGTTSMASAQDGDSWWDRGEGDRFGNDRGGRFTECTVTLERNDRNRGTLDVKIDASRFAAGRNARVTVDFTSDGRRDRGDTVERAALDRRGDVDLSFAIPRRANSVDVSVNVRGSRISCTGTLNLDRGRGGGGWGGGGWGRN